MDKSGNGIEHPMLNVAKILAEQKIENVRERECVCVCWRHQKVGMFILDMLNDRTNLFNIFLQKLLKLARIRTTKWNIS